MNNLDRLKLFKYMFNDLVQQEESHIKTIALNKWMSRSISAVDALSYAIEVVINKKIDEENSKVLKLDTDK